MDDVTKSIDKDSREAINKVIDELKMDKTVIIVTHNSREIDINSNIIYLDQVDDPQNNILPPLPDVVT